MGGFLKTTCTFLTPPHPTEERQDFEELARCLRAHLSILQWETLEIKSYYCSLEQKSLLTIQFFENPSCQKVDDLGHF
jgi:hypothetical protein